MWLGKNSSQSKSKRQIRELKFSMAHQCQAGKLAIQSEYVPMILTAVSCYLTENNPDEAIEWLDDMKVTND